MCCLPGCPPLTAGWGAARVGGRLPAVRSQQPAVSTSNHHTTPHHTTPHHHYQPPPVAASVAESGEWTILGPPGPPTHWFTHQYRDLEKAWRERRRGGEGETGPLAGGCVGLSGHSPALASPPRSLPHNLLQGIN